MINFNPMSIIPLILPAEVNNGKSVPIYKVVIKLLSLLSIIPYAQEVTSDMFLKNVSKYYRFEIYYKTKVTFKKGVRRGSK